MSADPERHDRPTGLQRRRARRIAPLAHELEPDVELYDVADAPDGPVEPLQSRQSDESDSSAMATAADDLGKPRRPYSGRPPGGWLAVPVEDEPSSLGRPSPLDGLHEDEPQRLGAPSAADAAGEDEPQPPRSWRSADDAQLAQLLAWQPPDVADPDPLAAVVVLSPVTPGAQRPAALLAYFAALADDTDRTSYAAADAGADELAATLVRVAAWLRSVASLSDAS